MSENTQTPHVALLLPLVLLATQFLSQIWSKHIYSVLMNQITKLEYKRYMIKTKMPQYNSPSTFHKYAKLERVVNAIEKELERLSVGYRILNSIAIGGTYILAYGLIPLSAIIWRNTTVFKFGQEWNQLAGVSIGVPLYLIMTKFALNVFM